MSFREYLVESKYEINHDSYTSAIKAAQEFAEKMGYEIDEEEWAQTIGLGPGKPSAGKTNKFHMDLFKKGKKQKKMLHIQVYNRETDKNPYELNTYIN